MKKPFSTLLVLILLVNIIAMSSCKKNINKEYLQTIIDSEVCTPPCWRGITPGSTTFDEAWTIAQSLVSTENSSNEKSPLSISSKWIDIDLESVWVGLRSDSRGIINKITFSVNQRYWNEPELQDLIEIYGNPISVDICYELMEVQRVVVWLRYPDMAFVYSEQIPFHEDSFGDPITIHLQKDTEIGLIIYKLPDLDPPSFDFSFPWKDYGDMTITPAEKNPLSTCPWIF